MLADPIFGLGNLCLNENKTPFKEPLVLGEMDQQRKNIFFFLFGFMRTSGECSMCVFPFNQAGNQHPA